MAHASNLFHSVPVEVQNKSGFDLSFDNLFTACCGELTPVLSKEVIPATSFGLGCSLEIDLPPLASNFFGRIDAIVESFFVPYRILYGGWKKFFTNSARVDNIDYIIPFVSGSDIAGMANEASQFSHLVEGTLSDYLGNRFSASRSEDLEGCPDISLMKYLAYHKIWDDWYRNNRVQKSLFDDYDYRSIVAALPYKTLTSTEGSIEPADLLESFQDGSSILDMRQRNYAKDYFTNAWPDMQQGATPISFTFSGNSFTINGLRAANSLAKWADINGLGGNEYDDLIYANFGIRPADSITDRAIYLGRQICPVYSRGVTLTSNARNTRNPFTNRDNGSPATEFGSASASGDSSLVESFTASEYGVVMCLFSLVPHAYYGYGIRRENMHTKIGDFGFPTLQSMGMQEIYQYELYAEGQENPVFGYSDRYSEFKYIDDEVHGQLRPNRPLQYFALQRSFASAPALGSDFIEIGKSDLDGIFSIGFNALTYSCWGHCGFVFHSSMPLAEYSIPTLGDSKDTHTIRVENGGRML